MAELRVCLATDCYQPGIGGIENHVRSLAQGLAEAGHQVDVVTHRAPSVGHTACVAPADGGDGFRVLRLEGAVVSYGGADPMVDPRVFGRVYRLLQGSGYDIVHGHSFESLLVLGALRAATRLGIPTLLTKHSMTARANRPALFNRLAVAAEKRVAARWTLGLIVLSAAGVREMAGAGVPIHLVHGGVDAQRWRPNRELRVRTRERLGYRPEELVIGYLGRLVSSKGVLSLIEAVAPLMQTANHLRLLLAGDGPLLPELRRRLRSLGLEGRTLMIGAVPWAETPAYLNAMDVFAFPSYTEAFGLALLEAMACGLPTVARESAGTEELVQDERTGFLVRTDLELRQRLERLIQDAELRRRIGREGRALAESRFSWAGMASTTAAIYQETMQQALARRSPSAMGSERVSLPK
ncbi:MAG: glycosyltransferase family 4 protein [Anaerolineae bacterium]|nr:glycosyltransferase family 4 protein [Anaerolineae bacterium]